MKSDNDLLHEYLDKRNTPKTIAELHNELLERQREYGRERMLPNVSTLKVIDDGYIKKLAVSDVNDLITDNFGYILSSMFSVYLGNGASVPLVDSGGAVRNVKTAGTQAVANTQAGFFANGWSQAGVQLGTGVTPVARSDFKTETPCLGNLGAIYFSTGAGYGSGDVTWNIQAGPATVAEGVTEGTLYYRGPLENNTPTTGAYYAFLRYNYSLLNVGIGESVVAAFTIGV